MNILDFSITQKQLKNLLTLYPNTGKNSHVGKIAVEVAKLYFLSINDQYTFLVNKNGVDLSVMVNGQNENYEIKGTADKNIGWNKLKVSSYKCYKRLVDEKMPIIRITNIGSKDMTLYFLKFGEDFELNPEARWAVVEKKV